MLLEGKNAVIYGGGGSIGGAVARAFGHEGARVFLAGRTLATLEVVAEEIRSAGGAAETAEVDALDPQSVDAHADALAAAGGSLDISFNVITHPYTHGTPMAEMDVDDYAAPVETAVRTTFLTTRAAARHMTRRKAGVLLAFGGSGDPLRDYYIGGTQVAFEAVESMRRQLSAELGPQGVRFVTLRTGGVPSSLDGLPDAAREAIVKGMEEQTLTGRAATLEDVGHVAAFVASDRARTMTAATVNVSAGALID
jgi:NAD(P)-dependent dehydrogenase (short-subunit alcohol dehydrogenase family)